jgi:hypothetical protein
VREIVAIDPWVVLDDEQRLQWLFTPLRGVGPLEFGMTGEEVKDAAAGAFRANFTTRRTPAGSMPREGKLARDHPLTGLWNTNATVYFDDSGRLACVAVDALRGPQVRLDGMALAGQVPSRMAVEFGDYLVERDMVMWIGQDANLSSPALGLVLRVQRTGDHLLTRPLMVAAEWADSCGDTQESLIPEMEWPTY